MTTLRAVIGQFTVFCGDKECRGIFAEGDEHSVRIIVYGDEVPHFLGTDELVTCPNENCSHQGRPPTVFRTSEEARAKIRFLEAEIARNPDFSIPRGPQILSNRPGAEV